MAHRINKKWRSDDVKLLEKADFSVMLLTDQVLSGLKKAGFVTPSPIQLEAIPIGRFGKDLLVQAKSGTGKTLVFTVIALENLKPKLFRPQVLIVAPTREIATQICSVIHSVGKSFPKMTCCAFIGGLPLADDKERGTTCQIAVGTPGRLRQLIKLGSLPINSIRLLVFDEADQLFQGTFKTEMDDIFKSLPDDKQVITTSATYPSALRKLILKYMRDPYIACINPNELALLGIVHYVGIVQSNLMPLLEYKNKLVLLEKILTSIKFSQCLVFCNMVSRVEVLCKDIKKWGFATTYISSAKQQAERLKVLDRLKHFKCKVLVSSDVTSRGIDAENVDLVINFDLAHSTETYLHRVGRAGRYGSIGVAITMITEKEILYLDNIEAGGNFKTYKLPDTLPQDLIRNPYLGEYTIKLKMTDSENESSSSDDSSTDVVVKTNHSVSNGVISHKKCAKNINKGRELLNDAANDSAMDIKENGASDRHSSTTQSVSNEIKVKDDLLFNTQLTNGDNSTNQNGIIDLKETHMFCRDINSKSMDNDKFQNDIKVCKEVMPDKQDILDMLKTDVEVNSRISKHIDSSPEVFNTKTILNTNEELKNVQIDICSHSNNDLLINNNDLITKVNGDCDHFCNYNLQTFDVIKTGNEVIDDFNSKSEMLKISADAEVTANETISTNKNMNECPEKHSSVDAVILNETVSTDNSNFLMDTNGLKNEDLGILNLINESTEKDLSDIQISVRNYLEKIQKNTESISKDSETVVENDSSDCGLTENLKQIQFEKRKFFSQVFEKFEEDILSVNLKPSSKKEIKPAEISDITSKEKNGYSKVIDLKTDSIDTDLCNDEHNESKVKSTTPQQKSRKKYPKTPLADLYIPEDKGESIIENCKAENTYSPGNPKLQSSPNMSTNTVYNKFLQEDSSNESLSDSSAGHQSIKDYTSTAENMSLNSSPCSSENSSSECSEAASRSPDHSDTVSESSDTSNSSSNSECAEATFRENIKKSTSGQSISKQLPQFSHVHHHKSNRGASESRDHHKYRARGSRHSHRISPMHEQSSHCRDRSHSQYQGNVKMCSSKKNRETFEQEVRNKESYHTNRISFHNNHAQLVHMKHNHECQGQRRDVFKKNRFKSHMAQSAEQNVPFQCSCHGQCCFHCYPRPSIPAHSCGMPHLDAACFSSVQSYDIYYEQWKFIQRCINSTL